LFSKQKKSKFSPQKNEGTLELRIALEKEKVI